MLFWSDLCSYAFVAYEHFFCLKSIPAFSLKPAVGSHWCPLLFFPVIETFLVHQHEKLLDGGDYEYPQEVDTDTVADRFDEVMDFIFWDGMMESEETVKKLKIRVSDLERDDFDD